MQQVGRAGRDGRVAQCITFLEDEEFLRLRSLTFSDGVDAHDLGRLLTLLFPPGAQPGACAALSLAAAEAEVGLRLEVVETLLSFLHLGTGLPGDAPLLAPLPEMRATLCLAFHRSDPAALAETSPLVAAVLSVGKERMGRHTVAVTRLAAELGVSFVEVQEQLRLLAATGEVSYTAADRALCVQLLRVPADVDALAAALAERLTAAERCQVGKLDAMYSALLAAESCQAAPERERTLRGCIAAYFDAPEDAEGSATPEVVKSSSIHLLGDVRALLREAGDVLTSGRLVARVLHGLANAHISTDVWRKHASWGRYAAVDFGVVARVAQEEISRRK